MNDKIKLIYLAGLLDGEGYISIAKRIGRKCPDYHARIVVNMSDPRPLYLLKEMFGGCLVKRKGGCFSKKQLFHYEIRHVKAYNAVKKLYPYLIIKKDNALQILNLYRNKVTYDISKSKIRTVKGLDKILNYRESLYLKCKFNNHINFEDTGL